MMGRVERGWSTMNINSRLKIQSHFECIRVLYGRASELDGDTKVDDHGKWIKENRAEGECRKMSIFV